MMAPHPPRIVLVGAGHGHMVVARQAAILVRAGLELTVVDPGEFSYSGMAPAVLAGDLPAAANRIDPAAVVAVHGGRFVRATVAGLDLTARRVLLSDGATLPYDAVSLDIGSGIDLSGIAGLAEVALPVKPVANLAWLRRELETRLTAGERLRLLVIGGGVSGCEVAATAAALAARLPGALAVTLVGRSHRLLPRQPARVARYAAAALAARGVAVVTGCGVARVDGGIAECSDGRQQRFDLVVAASGLAPPPLVTTLELPRDGGGWLRVDETLRSLGDPRVLALGDCATIEGSPRPKLGVFAVRAAAVLHANLLALAHGGAPRRYQPQRRWLAILNLGGGEAIAWRGRLVWRGRLALVLKHAIDRRFMASLHG